MTREGDTNPSLAHRAQAAKEHAADAFVSLHANAGQPAVRGTEVYVHERSNDESRALAASVSRALAEQGLPQLGLRRAPMAVLDPHRLGRRAAACLVEVDYLTNPDVERRLGAAHELDALADQLSSGIRSYLERPAARGYGGGLGSKRRYGDESYFTDADQLTAYLRDERGADTERITTVADAQALVPLRGELTVAKIEVERAEPAAAFGIRRHAAARPSRSRIQNVLRIIRSDVGR